MILHGPVRLERNFVHEGFYSDDDGRLHICEDQLWDLFEPPEGGYPKHVWITLYRDACAGRQRIKLMYGGMEAVVFGKVVDLDGPVYRLLKRLADASPSNEPRKLYFKLEYEV